MEIRRTLDWLQERLNYWRNEVRRRQKEADRAGAALEQCRAMAGLAAQAGVAISCAPQEAAFYQALNRLRQAQSELRNVQDWIRLVRQTARIYQRQARRLRAWMSNELPKANAFLADRIRALQSYTATGTAAGGYATTPPVQAVGQTFTAAVGLATVGLAPAAVAVINRMAGDIRHALGDVGEALSAQLLHEQFDLQEVPFDQPKHGFDRVLTAPGLPLIVMESKVTATGKFQPGQTRHGEQGSPAWIAAQAAKMADPSSAQWSPTNERIAALIQELGPENIPAVAVVIQSETGQANVYVRPIGAETWQPLRKNVPLTEALAGAEATGT